MRENRFFILSADLSGLTPVLVAGKPAIQHYADLVEGVEAICGRDAAALFAEPVSPRDADAQGAAISWYGPREGRSAELTSFDEIARRPIAERLTERLNALAPAFAAPDLGPLLAACLTIRSVRDILAVGGEPLIVNWGYLPADIAADPLRRRQHFDSTIGLFAPALAALAAPSPARAAQAPERPATETPRLGPAAFAATPAPGGAAGDGRAAAPPWRAPLVATLIAGAALAILLWPGVLAYPDRSAAPARDAFEVERLKKSNESLEDQLKALEALDREKSCRVGGPELIPVPDAASTEPDRERTAPRMELAPRAPEQVPLVPRASGEQPQAANVGELLEKSTVLVIAPQKPKGVSTGTGFFISDRHVVTNRHVIEGANEENVFIASKTFNGVRRARVIARTEPPPSESEPRPDLAVLEVEPIAGVGALRLTGAPPKLSTAYVAGFPGFLIQRDATFAKLFKELGESLGHGDSDQGLANRQIPVPGADLRYGRINNVMTTGRLELPIVIHDMQLAQGNSGGPVVDACGRLGGVNTMLFPNKEAGYQQGNVAQDVTVLRKFLTDKQIAFTADDAPCGAVSEARAGGGSGQAPPTQGDAPRPDAPNRQ